MALDFERAPYEQASPSLLARQPPSLPSRDARPGKDWGQIFAHLEARMGVMRSWRYSWWAHWSVIAQFLLPRRYHWLVVENRMARGSPINDQIVDTTATLAMQVCASGMWTGLTSPSRPWFKFGIGLPWAHLDADGKEWIEDTEKRVYIALSQSNFYTTMAQAFQDVTAFGTAPMIIYEDHEDVIRCYLPAAGEYYLAVGPRFSVDTLYREFTLSVAQIVEMFTLERCPESIRTLWRAGGGSIENEFVVCHAIEPNFRLSGRGAEDEPVDVVPGRFVYRELYWLKGQKTEAELSRRGFFERPFMAARWSVVSNDPYGRSPAMDALGDIRQVQQETRRKAEFIEKGVRPPMGGDPELKNEPSSILPGMVTYVTTAGGKKGFWPLFEVHPAWLAGITADIDKVNARIERTFFVDLFMAITRMEGVQPRNELELTKRDLERLQGLGPFIELFETEFADHALMRVLAILERRRMLRPKPKSLDGVPLQIKYTSIMRLAQIAAENVAMKDGLATGGQLSAASKAAGLPDPLRIVNLDKAYREYLERANFPADALYTDEEVQRHDAARQQVMQQQQMASTGMAAVTAAKTLADTPTDGTSALSALLGSGTGSTTPGT